MSTLLKNWKDKEQEIYFLSLKEFKIWYIQLLHVKDKIFWFPVVSLSTDLSISVEIKSTD